METKVTTKAEGCPFCHVDRETIVENEHALAFLDLFPVSAGHSLVIPKIHIESVFELPSPIYVACFTLARDLKNILQKKHNPDGFNVGINCGVHAGQTVMHAHIHVMPRYQGDIRDPRGGVRHIIPGKGIY
jgi:diadenosine tetraphosphate (Ap4A) HIT family hydrolase